MLNFFSCLSVKIQVSRIFQLIILSLSIVSINACTYLQNLFASSASSASLGSLSASSGSSAISHSIESIISSPSQQPQVDESYSNEVVDYTHAFVTFPPAKGDYILFNQGIGKIALRNGIVDWENNPKTYFAIGKGLKKANLKGSELDNYKDRLAGSDYARMRDIQKGYDSR
jgi:hypothetical protein